MGVRKRVSNAVRRFGNAVDLRERQIKVEDGRRRFGSSRLFQAMARGWTTSRVEANRNAQRQRDKGFLARVRWEPSVGQYAVYRHPPEPTFGKARPVRPPKRR